MSHAEFVQRKQRQTLQRDCEQLRQLAQQLHAAYVTKELHDQIAVNKKRHEMVIRDKKKEGQIVESERLKAIEIQRENELRTKERQKSLHASLSLQVDECRKRKKEIFEKSVVDREQRKSIIEQIEKEQISKQAEQHQRKIKYRHEILELVEQQKLCRKLDKEKDKYDAQVALTYQKLEDQRKQEIDKRKLESIRKHQELTAQVGKQMYEIENEKRSRDFLLLELLGAEYKAKEDEKLRRQLEDEEQKRLRVQRELEQYRVDLQQRNNEKELKRLEELASFRLETKKSTQEIFKQEEALKYKQRKTHGTELLAMILENQKKRAEATAEHLQYLDMKARTEAERQAIIEQERLNMLAGVPKSVLRFLPRNTNSLN